MEANNNQPTVEDIPLEMFLNDQGTQLREEINQAVVLDYIEVLDSGGDLPPIEAVRLETGRLVPTDGYHRFYAHRDCKPPRKTIKTIVHAGDIEKAKWLASGANKAHGFRRSNETKRNAIVEALKNSHGAGLSDGAIAAHVGVSPKSVASVRGALETAREIPSCTERVGLDGKKRKSPKKADAHGDQNPAENRGGHGEHPETAEPIAPTIDELQADVDSAEAQAGLTDASEEMIANASYVLNSGEDFIVKQLQAGTLELPEAIAMVTCERGGYHECTDKDANGRFCVKCKVSRSVLYPEAPDLIAPDELALSDAMIRVGKELRAWVDRVMKWFPQQHVKVLGERLMSAGDELREKGDIR